MRKIFALLAVAFGVMSCQTDVNDFGANVGGEQDVNILVSLPEATRANSALGAFENVDKNEYDIRYIFQVFNADGTANKEMQYEYSDETTVSFPVRLIPGREYNFAVWADLVENGKTTNNNYTIDKDKTLKEISLNEWAPMDETRDAYTGKWSGTFSGAQDITIPLTRPFAKLRVVTTDMKELLGVVPTKATVEYTTTYYAKFNAFAQAPVEESATAKKTHTNFDIVSYDEGDVKKTLFADYIFAKDTQEVVNFKLSVFDQSDVIIGDVMSFSTAIPVKRNNLTTIEGNILTVGDDITVKVEEEFENADKIEDAPYYVEIWDGESQTQPDVVVDQTTGEQVAVIGQASELAWLAAYVNGTLAEGASTLATRAGEIKPVKFVLGADIDLGGFPWTPIGTSEKNFVGTFDGAGHTIYNLNINVAEGKDSKAYMGLIGYAKNATIQNLTLENVDINVVCLDIDHSQGHIGAVAGSLEGESTIENVTVKGDIKVEASVDANGASRVAVVAGGNSYGKVTMKNVHVIANEGSYLKANNNVGALAGQLQGVSVFVDCSSNINVTGTKFFAGGIIGLAAGDQTFTNCHTTGNITITAGREGKAHDHYRVGGIAGGWADGAKNVCTLTNCSYTGELSGTNADGSVVDVFDYAGYVGRGYTLNNCQGSKVVIDGVEYVQAYNTAAEAGIYYVNGELILNNAAALKLVASKVNNGIDYFEGKTIKLGADIDLNNAEWTPIGSAYADHGFMGNFDGNGFAVKNLKITALTPDADQYVYGGLFGVTEGVDKDNQNYIKNLTIENVNIDLDGHIVAAAIAYPYYTALENITVKGNVSIKGGNYTAGVLAYTRRCVDAENISIKANEGSVIEGAKTIGGVISDIQTNGGLVANYSNFKAENLTIKGTQSVGGISGIICLQTLNGATVKNVTIVCDDVRKGKISGSLGDTSVINSVVVENVEGAENLVGATYDSGKTSKVTIDGVVYEYLANGTYKVDGAIVVSTSVALDAAIKAGETTILLKEGVYVIPNSAQKKTLVIKGLGQAANTKIATNNTTGSYEGCNYALDGSTVTFENISINTPSTVYIGYARCKATYKGCLFNGTYTLYDNSTFENCVFNVSGDVYNVWTWGAPVATFTDCTFNSDGKAMLLYGQANTKLTINDCVFNDNGGLADLKAAIEIGNDYNSSYELIVNNTVVNGYEINDKGINTGTTLWANKNSMGQDKLNVVVDGVDVY